MRRTLFGFDQRRPGDAAQDAESHQRLSAVPKRRAFRDAGIAVRRDRRNPFLSAKRRTRPKVAFFVGWALFGYSWPMSATVVTVGYGYAQPRRQERALIWGLFLSLALHALALLGLPQRSLSLPTPKTEPVLRARLVPAETAPAKPSASSQLRPKAKPSPKPQPQRHPRPKPVPRKPARAARPAPIEPAPAPVPRMTVPNKPAQVAAKELAPAASITEDSGELQSEPAKAAPAIQAPASAPQTKGIGQGGSEIDKRILEEYRLALIAATRRYKRYPGIAMEKGWQGRAVVRMVIGANGMLASATIKTSSGYEILDKEAMAMLKKGKTTVPIPAKLRGREFHIDVPVIFNLEGF